MIRQTWLSWSTPAHKKAPPPFGGSGGGGGGGNGCGRKMGRGSGRLTTSWSQNNEKVYRKVVFQGISGAPNPQYFLTSTEVQMGGVLPYKWAAYCSTNGRCTAGFPFLKGLEARKGQRYKWGVYCRTNWGCTAVLFRRVVRVGCS